MLSHAPRPAQQPRPRNRAPPPQAADAPDAPYQATLKRGHHTFHLLLSPPTATLPATPLTDTVFTNPATGEKPSQNTLHSAFGTVDAAAIAAEILASGHVQSSGGQRLSRHEAARARVVAALCHRWRPADARGPALTPAAADDALRAVGARIDPDVDPLRQAALLAPRVADVLPIRRRSVVSGVVVVPRRLARDVAPVLAKHAEVVRRTGGDEPRRGRVLQARFDVDVFAFEQLMEELRAVTKDDFEFHADVKRFEKKQQVEQTKETTEVTRRWDAKGRKNARKREKIALETEFLSAE